eukprot:619138-Pyramimonas_sp.AAC.1
MLKIPCGPQSTVSARCPEVGALCFHVHGSLWAAISRSCSAPCGSMSMVPYRSQSTLTTRCPMPDALWFHVYGDLRSSVSRVRPLPLGALCLVSCCVMTFLWATGSSRS